MKAQTEKPKKPARIPHSHRSPKAYIPTCLACNPLADDLAFFNALLEPLNAAMHVAYASHDGSLPVAHPWYAAREELYRRRKALLPKNEATREADLMIAEARGQAPLDADKLSPDTAASILGALSLLANDQARKLIVDVPGKPGKIRRRSADERRAFQREETMRFRDLAEKLCGPPEVAES